jgi:flagellar secretion chaperone FliS
MNERSYRRAAIEGASSVALVIMLYDRLALDMGRAISAMRSGDIEGRCAELKHALLILQQLEGSLDHERGGEAARNLAALYSYARAKIMQAQLKHDATLLEEIVGHFLDVKRAWQKVESRITEAAAPLEPVGWEDQRQPQKSLSGETLLSCTV